MAPNSADASNFERSPKSPLSHSKPPNQQATFFFRTQVMRKENVMRIRISPRRGIYHTSPIPVPEKLCTPLRNTGLRVNLPQKIPVRLKGSGFCVKHVSNMKCSLSDKLQQGAMAGRQSSPPCFIHVLGSL